MEIFLLTSKDDPIIKVMVDGEIKDVIAVVNANTGTERYKPRDLRALASVLEETKDENNLLSNGCIINLPPPAAEKRLRYRVADGAACLEKWITSETEFKGFEFAWQPKGNSMILFLPPKLRLGVVDVVEYESFLKVEASREQSLEIPNKIIKEVYRLAPDIDLKIVPLVKRPDFSDEYSMKVMVDMVLNGENKLFFLNGKIGSGKTYGLQSVISERGSDDSDDSVLLMVNATDVIGKSIDEVLEEIAKTAYGAVDQELFKKTLHGDDKTVLLIFDQMQNLVHAEQDELAENVLKWLSHKRNMKVLFLTRDYHYMNKTLMVKGGIAAIKTIDVFEVKDLDEMAFKELGIGDELSAIKIRTPLMYSVLAGTYDKKFPKIDTVFDILDYYYKKLTEYAEKENGTLQRVLSYDALYIAYCLQSIDTDKGLTVGEINKAIRQVVFFYAPQVDEDTLSILCDVGIMKCDKGRYRLFFDPFKYYLSSKHIEKSILHISNNEERYNALYSVIHDIIDATRYDNSSGKEIVIQYATFMFLALAKGDSQIKWKNDEKRLIFELGVNIGYEDPTIWNDLFELLDWFASSSGFSDKGISRDTEKYKLAVTVNGSLYEKISVDKITIDTVATKTQTLDKIQSLYFRIFPCLIRYEGPHSIQLFEQASEDAIQNAFPPVFLGKLYGNIGALNQEYAKALLCKAEDNKSDRCRKECLKKLDEAEFFHSVSLRIKDKFGCSGKIRSLISSATDSYYRAALESLYDTDRAVALYKEACERYSDCLSLYNKDYKGNSTAVQQAEEPWVFLWRWAGCLRELYDLTYNKTFLLEMLSKQREAVKDLLDAVDNNEFIKYRNRKYIKEFIDDIIGDKLITKDKGDLERYVSSKAVKVNGLTYIEDLIDLYNSCGFFLLIPSDVVQKSFKQYEEK